MHWTFTEWEASALARLRSQRKALLGLMLLLAAVIGLIAWNVTQRTQRELALARLAAGAKSLVPFERQTRASLTRNGLALVQNRRTARALVQFNQSYFAATDGGLVEYSAAGTPQRIYTVLDGLPESDLTSLAVFQGKLAIGLRTQGLALFDGARFERYRWLDRDAQAVTVLREDRGRLLVGTFAGGLLEFDGKQFQEIAVTGEQKRLLGINCLFADNRRLLVGTFADGLWLNESGRWQHFTVADGLPSNRIVSVLPDNERLLIATDFGIASAELGIVLSQTPSGGAARFQTLATLPATTSLIRVGAVALVGKDNGELFQLAFDQRTQAQLLPVGWARPESLSSCQLITFVQHLEHEADASLGSFGMLSSEGIWRSSWQGKRLSGRLPMSKFGETAAPLSDNLISALAFDDLGRLWVGSFRNGITVLTAEGRQAARLESESVREINALVWDDAAKRMLAATAQGLLSFDASFQLQRLSTTDGLLSNSIAHIASLSAKSPANPRRELALATSRGLAVGQATQWRALTAVQGLPSNSVYTVLPQRESLLVGTLNGLAQVTAGRVVRVYRDANSKLTHNWITALAAAGPRTFVGTYGGGIFELTAAGELVSFAAEIGKQTINPNALVADGEWLYAGTLDGVWALNLQSQKWFHLRQGLPAAAVLSLTTDGQQVYVGTTSGIARIEKTYFRSAGEE